MGTYVNSLLANVGIFLLLALGLNIVVGLAGILDLGYVVVAVGAYTTAVLTSELSPFFAPGMTWVLSAGVCHYPCRFDGVIYWSAGDPA